MSFANWKPQRTKFRRLCKGVLKTVSFSESNNSLKYGWYGLQSLGQTPTDTHTPAPPTKQQAGERAITQAVPRCAASVRTSDRVHSQSSPEGGLAYYSAMLSNERV